MVWERATGRAIHPAIVWQDRRTEAVCAALRAAGHEPLVRERTGLELDATFPATKLALGARPRRRRPRGGARPASWPTATSPRWLAPPAHRRVHVTDAGNAGRTLLCPLGGTDWDAELLELFGDPARAAAADRRLRLGVRRDRRRRRRRSARRRRRRPAGFAVRAALLEPGAGEGHARHRRVPARPGGHAAAAPPDGVLGSTARGAREHDRLRARGLRPRRRRGGRLVRPRSARSAARRELDALLRSRAATDDVVCVPALQGLGVADLARRAHAARCSGLASAPRAPTSRAPSSTACSTRSPTASRRSGRAAVELIRLDGGLSRSDWVVQRLADLSGVPVERTARADSTALGAALLGGLAAGVWGTLAELPPTAGDLRADPAMPDVERRRARDRWAEVIALAAGFAPSRPGE